MRVYVCKECVCKKIRSNNFEGGEWVTNKRARTSGVRFYINCGDGHSNSKDGKNN